MKGKYATAKLAHFAIATKKKAELEACENEGLYAKLELEEQLKRKKEHPEGFEYQARIEYDEKRNKLVFRAADLKCSLREIHRLNGNYEKLMELSDPEFRTKLNAERDSRRYLPMIEDAIKSRTLPEGISKEEFVRLTTIEIGPKTQRILQFKENSNYEYAQGIEKMIVENGADPNLVEKLLSVAGSSTLDILQEYSPERLKEFFGYNKRNESEIKNLRLDSNGYHIHQEEDITPELKILRTYLSSDVKRKFEVLYDAIEEEGMVEGFGSKKRHLPVGLNIEPAYQLIVDFFEKENQEFQERKQREMERQKAISEIENVNCWMGNPRNYRVKERLEAKGFF